MIALGKKNNVSALLYYNLRNFANLCYLNRQKFANTKNV